MQGYKFNNITFLLNYDSILLSSSGIEFESSNSVEYFIYDDGLIFFYDFNLQIFLFVNVSDEINILLIPVYINGSQNLLVSDGSQNEFGTTLQFKIISLIDSFFQMNLFFLFALFQSDFLLVRIHNLLNCLVITMHLLFSKDRYIHPDEDNHNYLDNSHHHLIHVINVDQLLSYIFMRDQKAPDNWTARSSQGIFAIKQAILHRKLFCSLSYLELLSESFRPLAFFTL